MGVNVLFLEGGTRDHFMNFLAREYPNLRAGYQQMYQGKYAPDAYRKEVRGMVEMLQQRHQVARRARRIPEQDQQKNEGQADWPAPAAPEQGGFQW
jgi:hypothetical protein